MSGEPQVTLEELKPEKETHISYDKLVLYYQSVTKETADALETLIEQASVFLPAGELENAREALDHAREHLAGWNGPIRWFTTSEAERYTEQANFHAKNGNGVDFKPIKIKDGLNVFVPK